MEPIPFCIQKHHPFECPITPRMAAVMHCFGLTTTQLRKYSFWHVLELELRDGDICCITGPSGIGKTVLLNAMYDSVPENQRLRLSDIPLEDDRSLIDCMAAGEQSIDQTMEILTAAGFNDALEMLTSPALLSDGQKYRYRLARAMQSGRRVVFADAFLENLDVITQNSICRNLRQFVNVTEQIFILASHSFDSVRELEPDFTVVKQHHGRADIHTPWSKRRVKNRHQKPDWCDEATRPSEHTRKIREGLLAKPERIVD